MRYLIWEGWKVKISVSSYQSTTLLDYMLNWWWVWWPEKGLEYFTNSTDMITVLKFSTIMNHDGRSVSASTFPEFVTYRTLYHIIEIVVNIQKVALGGDPFRFRWCSCLKTGRFLVNLIWLKINEIEYIRVNERKSNKGSFRLIMSLLESCLILPP